MAGLQAEIYTIFCAIAGENIAFPVDIANNKTVGFLKTIIKKEKPNRFASVDADELTLYRVDISGSIKEKIEKLKKMADDLDQEELNPLDELTRIYSTAPPKGTIHIIVQPPKSAILKRKRDNSNSPDSMDLVAGVAGKRRQLLEDSISTVAPSTFGGQETYKRLDQTKFVLNRPPVSETVPLAISHLIFGEFVQEAGTYTPTATDNALVRDLRNVMSKTYDTELDYCSEFRRVLRQHYTEVELQPAQIGNTKYVSDGHLSVGGFMSSVCEGKLWKGTGDPEVQAAGYFIASVRHSLKEAGDYPDKLPCMIIYIFGSFLCFAGTVVTDRLHLETLTPALPMHTNHHEGEIATQAARTLGAFRKAIKKLQVHYAELRDCTVARKKDKPFVNGEYEGLVYPYKTCYGNTGVPIDFRYLKRMDSTKLLFLCEATDATTTARKLCVKFTRKYSEDAHRYCALNGIAPELYAVESLPGGWIMVVMEYIDEKSYKHLLTSHVPRVDFGQEVRRVVGLLHARDFVHGDVRDVNLMVRRDWSETNDAKNVLLVDFDWAGPTGPTRYPPNVNRVDIPRPDGAKDGEPILKEHDLWMVEQIVGPPVGQESVPVDGAAPPMMDLSH